MLSRYRFNRRRAIGAASAAAAGLMAPGWSGGAAVRAAQDEPVTLRVWHVNETELVPINEMYVAEHPDTTIEYQYYPWGEFWDKLNAAYAAGDPPDVHRQDDDELPFFAARQTLAPMDDHLAGIVQDDLYWNIVELTRVGGKLWVSVPAFRVGSLLYNKTMFEQAGVALPPAAYPSDDWTWDAFVEASRALSKPDELVFGVGGVDDMDFVTAMVRSNGGDILSEDCLSFTLGEPVAVEAMQRVADLVLTDRAAADPESIEAFGSTIDMFNQGRLGMAITQTRETPPDDVDFEWGYAGWPIFPDKEPVVFAAIECFGVPAMGRHLEAATGYAATLMSPEAQMLLAATKNVIPINRQAAEDVWVPAGKADRAFLLDAANYGRTNPFAVGFGQVQDETWPIFGEIFLGQKTVEQALEEAVPMADAALQAAGGCLG
jgi:multiple sugar transport system substrate-binding protein